MSRFVFMLSLLLTLPAQAAGTLVWVDSSEGPTTALAQELQALAGPSDLFVLSGGKRSPNQAANVAINAAEEAWRKVRPDLMAEALKQAKQALRNDPAPGDAARMRQVLALEAAYEVGEFRAEQARAVLGQAISLGLDRVPPDLSHTLDPLLQELRAKAAGQVELNFRIPPGARIIVDDRAHDAGGPLKVSPGLHLVGAYLQGHRPSFRWIEASGLGSHVDLLPTAAPEFGKLKVELMAAARGDSPRADALRRSLNLDALVACSLRMLGGRYDARCVRFGADGSKRESVVSFHAGEPLAGPALRLWKGLQAEPSIGVGPIEPSNIVDPGRRYALAGGGLLTLGIVGLGTSGYLAFRTAELYDEYRATPQADTENLERLRVSGQSQALGADIAVVVGGLFTAIGSGLLYKARQKRRSVKAFLGAQP